MGLSNDERRRLDELASDIAAQDPRLARKLSENRKRRRKPRRQLPSLSTCELVAVVLSGIGMPLLVLGVILQTRLLLAVGAIALLAGPVIVAVCREDGPSSL